MITGHFGVAAMVRGTWPRTSLLWLLPASIAPDILDLCMAAAGICNPYGLYTHTLPAVALLATLLGGVAYLVAARTKAPDNAIAIALGCVLVIVLHPLLDFITGNKLLWPGGPLVGLGLYDRSVADFALESAITTVGWLMLRRSRAVPRWASTPTALSALLLLQGAADFSSRDIKKPSACAVHKTVL